MLVNPKSLIALVIQQWVESKIDDEKKFLREHKEAAENCFRLARLRADDPDYADDLLDDLQHLLVGTGLPITPGTAHWLLSKAQPDHPAVGDAASPTYGVLVTSVALAPNKEFIKPNHPHRVMAEMLHSLIWTAPWSNEPLVRKAKACSLTHEEWWRKQDQLLPKIVLSGRPFGGITPEMEADVIQERAGLLKKEQVVMRQVERILPAAVVPSPENKAAARKQAHDEYYRIQKRLSR